MSRSKNIFLALLALFVAGSAQAGTIGYEVLTRLSRRFHRLYRERG